MVILVIIQFLILLLQQLVELEVNILYHPLVQIDLEGQEDQVVEVEDHLKTQDLLEVQVMQVGFLNQKEIVVVLQELTQELVVVLEVVVVEVPLEQDRVVHQELHKEEVEMVELEVQEHQMIF